MAIANFLMTGKEAGDVCELEDCVAGIEVGGGGVGGGGEKVDSTVFWVCDTELEGNCAEVEVGCVELEADSAELEVDNTEVELDCAEVELDCPKLSVSDAEAEAGLMFIKAGSVKFVIRFVGSVLRFA